MWLIAIKHFNRYPAFICIHTDIHMFFNYVALSVLLLSKLKNRKGSACACGIQTISKWPRDPMKRLPVMDTGLSEVTQTNMCLYVPSVVINTRLWPTQWGHAALRQSSSRLWKTIPSPFVPLILHQTAGVNAALELQRARRISHLNAPTIKT